MTELEEALLERPSIGKDSAILCVDDEPQVLAALQRTLRWEPYEVLRAGGAREALDLIERLPIKVVVSDERMPRMFGSELLARVRKIRPFMGRILLTGFPSPAVTVRSLEAGSDFLITKPWDEEALKRTIRCLIHEVDKAQACGAGSPPDPWLDLGGEGS